MQKREIIINRLINCPYISERGRTQTALLEPIRIRRNQVPRHRGSGSSNIHTSSSNSFPMTVRLDEDFVTLCGRDTEQIVDLDSDITCQRAAFKRENHHITKARLCALV